MHKNRTLTECVNRVKNSFPVLLVAGPRQVGKTTLLRHISKDSHTYVTLDDPNNRMLAKNNPALFMQRFSYPLLIDEIQYAPELFSYIKMVVDEHKKPNMFWLTGSQQFHLMKNVSESLAGRVCILKLQGLSQVEEAGLNPSGYKPFLPTEDQIIALREMPHKTNLDSVYQRIWRGSFPNIALADGDLFSDSVVSAQDRDLFYSSYIQTYLERDVQDLMNIGSRRSFLKFLRAAAARSGQLLNYADIARDVDIAPITAKKWIFVLEASGIVYILEPYSTNRSKRLVKAPKMYFLDTGLCSYLAGWETPETLERGAMSGAIFETYAVSELLKSYWHNGKDARFFFYRDKDKKEIDIIIEKNNTLYPIEIKKTATPSKKDIKNFSLLKNLNLPAGHGALICLAQDILPITEEVDMIPVGCI